MFILAVGVPRRAGLEFACLKLVYPSRQWLLSHAALIVLVCLCRLAGRWLGLVYVLGWVNGGNVNLHHGPLALMYSGGILRFVAREMLLALICSVGCFASAAWALATP